ncbi:phytanoyl-CoA dioxygenase family protein [Urbifossiella limnaea]|uniref:Phytanoyl-CoA dioxygenase (PhyH) n=1 Tax=Urbifossiella limnaea TaxID=2528023 RepID=A0A517XV95_9BACT|nr:phytanoyl-CoA dioxygenase family protein [Urbifossiella limnaea]QDU21432.1 Phytanoyl-CoA dioxygenase (PhyH) [Urbifossiella limnaea]
MTTLAADGFVLLPAVFDAAAVADVRAACDTALSRHAGDPAILADPTGAVSGARDLFRLWPGAAELARAPALRDALIAALGAGAGVVRGLYFDKPPGHGWALPWHKDYTVAVRAHGPLGRFRKPTTKAGIPHLEAPTELLSRMLTARVHLDDMTDENGPLRVVPGSHRFDRTAADEPRPPVVVHCRAGDVLLMRPLLTHASGHADAATARHRRIVHLECAPAGALEDGYEWREFLDLS